MCNRNFGFWWYSTTESTRLKSILIWNIVLSEIIFPFQATLVFVTQLIWADIPNWFILLLITSNLKFKYKMVYLFLLDISPKVNSFKTSLPKICIQTHWFYLKRQMKEERERNVNLSFRLFMHSLVALCTCPDQRSSLQSWRTGTTV